MGNGEAAVNNANNVAVKYEDKGEAALKKQIM